MEQGLFTNSFGRTLGHRLGFIAGLGLAAGGALGQDYDIDWVTIGDVGNAAYPGDQFGQNEGRGSVGYEYRIGRYEVTTGQWLEFVNTYSTQSDELSRFALPFHWGATTDRDYDGPGSRYKLRDGVEQAAMIPVLGMDWREAAMFTNWLHNNKSSDLSAIEDGAYDISTFGTNNDGTFNDQHAHHPDAKFWIPTLDEWLKAAHYDPNRSDDDGWWLYNHTSNEAPVSGFPGDGETSTGLDWSTDGVRDIPLGSYLETLSPWGLLDTSGGAEEWTEEIKGRAEFRVTKGAGVAEPPEYSYLDQAGFDFWKRPNFPELRSGLRVVGLVPTPGSMVLVPAGLVCLGWRKRR